MHITYPPYLTRQDDKPFYLYVLLVSYCRIDLTHNKEYKNENDLPQKRDNGII